MKKFIESIASVAKTIVIAIAAVIIMLILIFGIIFGAAIG